MAEQVAGGRGEVRRVVVVLSVVLVALVIVTIAFVAGCLQKLLGPVGTLVTVVVIVMFGNPSSGGATGVPYLPTFWRDIGPYLPPRNAYTLLHQTIYFSGHGTSHALLVLLAYFAVAGVLLGILDWRHSEAHLPPAAPEAASLAVPIGATP